MISFAKWYAGAALPGKEESSRRHFQIRLGTQAIVQYYDVQRIQELSLVLVDALDLTVENRLRIHDLASIRF